MKYLSCETTIKQPGKSNKKLSSTLRVIISKSFVGSSRIKKLGFCIKTVHK